MGKGNWNVNYLFVLYFSFVVLQKVSAMHIFVFLLPTGSTKYTTHFINCTSAFLFLSFVIFDVST